MFHIKYPTYNFFLNFKTIKQGNVMYGHEGKESIEDKPEMTQMLGQ